MIAALQPVAHRTGAQDMQADRVEAQLRAGMHGRLSEIYGAAELVPIQLERGAGHAGGGGWTVVATFIDDGHLRVQGDHARVGFAELVAAIEADKIDMMVVRDIDRLTRNLPAWNAFETACVGSSIRSLTLWRTRERRGVLGAGLPDGGAVFGGSSLRWPTGHRLMGCLTSPPSDGDGS